MREVELTRKTHTFARDTRTWKMFSEALEQNRARLGKVNRRVREMMDKLSELGGDTRQSIQGRLKGVQAVLDEKG